MLNKYDLKIDHFALWHIEISENMKSQTSLVIAVKIILNILFNHTL